MAYKAEEDKPEGGTSTTGGAAGILGQSGPINAGSGVQQKSTAGNPGGWTNIQDYLGANPGAGQQMAQNIQGAAQKQVSDIKSQIPTYTPTKGPIAPETNQIQNYLTTGQGFGDIQKGYNQKYQTPTISPETFFSTTEGQIKGLEEKANQMKPGVFSGIMNYFGNVNTPQGTYTPVMQGIDQLFLMNQPGFAQQFPQQFAQNVSALRASLTGEQGAETKAKQAESDIQTAYQNAPEQWKQTIQQGTNFDTSKIAENQDMIDRYNALQSLIGGTQYTAPVSTPAQKTAKVTPQPSSITPDPFAYLTNIGQAAANKQAQIESGKLVKNPNYNPNNPNDILNPEYVSPMQLPTKLEEIPENKKKTSFGKHYGS